METQEVGKFSFIKNTDLVRAIRASSCHPHQQQKYNIMKSKQPASTERKCFPSRELSSH